MFRAFIHHTFMASALAMLFPALSKAETVVFEGQNWTVTEGAGGTARLEEFLGREALFLRQANASMQGVNLGDLVIEYDYAASHQSGFIGVNFRVDAESPNLEQFYTRPHQTGQPDATQYMVLTNGSATWQLHAGPNEAAATDLPASQWIRVRIVAIGERADIFVGDMETPLLNVPRLRSSSRSGGFSLYASDRPFMPHTGAYFSNISVRAATSRDAIVGTPKATKPIPEGLLTSFDVSDPFSEDIVAGAAYLSEVPHEMRTWRRLDVEDDGVANLARLAGISGENNTVFVRITVTSEIAATRMLDFGYSDRIRFFVDGQLVYFGNAQWRSRDHRFLGTVGLKDSLAVHLQPGETEIVAAISESFGGWGFKAAWRGNLGNAPD